MKRFGFVLLIAVLLAGTVSAQSRDNQRQNNAVVTIEGTLKLDRGFVAVESGDSVYYVPMLNRYIGFISDLREGAGVSVEGYASRRIINPTKITIEGKSYDFIASGQNAPRFRNDSFGPARGGFEPRGNFGRDSNNFRPDRRNAPNRGDCGCGRR